MFENRGDRTDYEVDTTAIQEYERIKSSEIEVSEGMGSVDIKRNRFSFKENKKTLDILKKM